MQTQTYLRIHPPHVHTLSLSVYLHVSVDHEVQAIEVKVTNLTLQLVFDAVEAVQHDPLHLFLGKISQWNHSNISGNDNNCHHRHQNLFYIPPP